MCSNIEYHITDEESYYFEIISLDYKKMLDCVNSEDAIKIDNTSLISNYYAVLQNMQQLMIQYIILHH